MTDKHSSRNRVWLAAIRRVRRPELPVLVALFALTSLTWGFVKLAGEVHEGDTQAFDQHLVEVLRNPENPRCRADPFGWPKRAATSRPWAASPC